MHPNQKITIERYNGGADANSYPKLIWSFRYVEK